LIESKDLDRIRAERYAGWDGELGRSIESGATLDDLHRRAMTAGEPARASGHQELLENLVARHIERVR
jgi:xylose isomerase